MAMLEFGKQIDSKMPAMLEILQKEGLSWNGSEEKNLLALRKKLAGWIKKGMLDRKDEEAEIALLAMLVWYNRLEETQRMRVIGEWQA